MNPNSLGKSIRKELNIIEDYDELLTQIKNEILNNYKEKEVFEFEVDLDQDDNDIICYNASQLYYMYLVNDFCKDEDMALAFDSVKAIPNQDLETGLKYNYTMSFRISPREKYVYVRI